MSWKNPYNIILEFIKLHIRENKENIILNKWLVYNYEADVVNIEEVGEKKYDFVFWMYKGSTTELVTEELIKDIKQKQDELYGL